MTEKQAQRYGSVLTIVLCSVLSALATGAWSMNTDSYYSHKNVVGLFLLGATVGLAGFTIIEIAWRSWLGRSFGIGAIKRFMGYSALGFTFASLLGYPLVHLMKWVFETLTSLLQQFISFFA